MTDASARKVFGAVDLMYGLALGVLVLWALPERHWVVDVLGALASVVCIAAGSALAIGVPWAARAAQAAATILLVLGVVLLGGIVGSIGFLHGIYGAIGELGVAVLLVLAGLIVPYLVVFPLLQLARFRHGSGPVSG